MCLCGCVFICVTTCLLVLSFFHVRMYVHTGERVHTELFVAGLAPWEPILHLSIPHSRAQRSPDFTQNLPAADLFLSGIIDPIISKHSSLLSLCFLTHTVCFTPSLSSSFSPNLIKTYLYSPYALSHTQAQSLSHLRILVCNVTRIDTRQKQQIYTKCQIDFESHRCHHMI